MTCSKQTMKNINITSLLRALLQNGPISQTQLIDITGLKKATISVFINQLLARKLIQIIGSGNASLRGGRKPQFIDIDRANTVGLGIAVRDLTLQSGLYDLNGKELWQTSAQLEKNHSTVWGPIILKTIRKTLKKSADRHQVFIGTGFSIGCIFDPQKNVLRSISNSDEKDLSIGELFNSRLQDTFVVVDDFPNAMAIGEMWFGKAKNLNNFIYFQPVHPRLTVIIDNKIYRGHRFFAGEIGDCAAGAALIKDSKDREGFYSSAAFLQWLHDITLYYDPQRIIISAENCPLGLKEGLPAINDFIASRYKERFPDVARNDLVQLGALDAAEMVKGAAALVFENYFYSYRVQ